MTIAVGFFDGVHLGHQAILKGADLALTFSNHPLSLLAPSRAPRLIMTLPARTRAIESAGVPAVEALAFTADLAARSPADFLAMMRARAVPGPLSVRCGANWRFGRDGIGTAAWLRAQGVAVTVVPYATYDGAAISSTRVRAALAAGRMADVTAMLGRPYAVSGTLVPGKGLGRALGYPTLNVLPDGADGLLRPPLGVYVVELDGARAVANYGVAPTMGERAWRAPVWELHLLSAPSRHPAAPALSFRVLRHLRPERKFASPAELKAQIAADCEAARSL
ncbi:MAG: riboflavin kinase [Kiritimatiellia bacterium]